jgi:Uma2 family endonuclease
MAVQLLKRLFTVEEYHRMAEAGILSEDDRVELIEGEIVRMSPIGSRHAACVGRLTQQLVVQVGGRAIVRVQNPIRLGEHSEPQPDLALLRPRADFYAEAHPGPEDTLLIVEVSETSAAPDLEVKVPLYARFGVPEVWLVDLAGERLEVFRNPSPQGYQDLRILRGGEVITPLLLPDLSLAVEAILG